MRRKRKRKSRVKIASTRKKLTLKKNMMGIPSPREAGRVLEVPRSGRRKLVQAIAAAGGNRDPNQQLKHRRRERDWFLQEKKSRKQ